MMQTSLPSGSRLSHGSLSPSKTAQGGLASSPLSTHARDELDGSKATVERYRHEEPASVDRMTKVLSFGVPTSSPGLVEKPSMPCQCA